MRELSPKSLSQQMAWNKQEKLVMFKGKIEILEENDKNEEEKKKLTLKQLNLTSVSYIGCWFLDALLNLPPKKVNHWKRERSF